MYTLTQIKAAYENRKKDVSDVGDSLFLQWMTQIADFLYDMKRDVDPESLLSESTFIVSSAPQTSTLPSDFLGMQELKTGLYRVGDNGIITDDELALTGIGSNLPGYYLDGSGNIIFTGITTSTTYRMRYFPEFTPFSSLGEYFSLDKTISGKAFMRDSKLMYLIEAIDILYSRWDEDVASEITADQRFVRELQRLLDKDRRTPNAFFIPDPAQYF